MNRQVLLHIVFITPLYQLYDVFAEDIEGFLYRVLRLPLQKVAYYIDGASQCFVSRIPYHIHVFSFLAAFFVEAAFIFIEVDVKDAAFKLLFQRRDQIGLQEHLFAFDSMQHLIPPGAGQSAGQGAGGRVGQVA